MWERKGGEFFESVLQLMSDGFMVSNAAGNIYYVNPRAKELLGIHGEDISQNPLLRRLSPEIFSHFSKNILQTSHISEIAISYPEQRLLRVTFLPFDALMDLHAIILNDITAESKKKEENLESETLEAVSYFAGGIAHEIGNPVNTMKIHLQLLQRKIGEVSQLEQLKEHICICLEELNRIDHIIAYFLHAIKPVTPQLQEILLSHCLRKCHHILAAELKELNIFFTLKIDPDGTEGPIMGDREQLQQVFFNLMRNAMEAMEGGGNIAAVVTQTAKYSVVEICDNGGGIPADLLSQILKPYYTTKKNGNGLGLVIVQRILRAHRATFTIETHHPHGTRFILYFPLKNPQLPMLE